MKKILLSVLMLVSAGLYAQIPTNGLVAYYPFSGSPNDQSGNANHGTTYGGATLTTDRFGTSNSAYQFNGSSSYIEVPNSNSLQSPSNQVTLSAWIYITNTNVLNWILDKRIQTGSSPYSSYGLFSVLATNSLNAGVSTNTGVKSTGNTTIQTNTWMHISMVYTGSKIIYYTNGVPTDSTTVSGNIQYSSMSLYIGKSPNNAAYTQGKIDDIRIYNVALTPAQIQALRWEGVTCNLNITQQPKDSNTVFGMPAAFSVGTNSSGASYSWEVNDGNGFKPISSCLYSGSNSAMLNILGSLPWMDGYAYRCIVDNDTCSDTTDVVYLGVDSAYYQTIIDSILIADTLFYWDTIPYYDSVTVYDSLTLWDSVSVYDTITVYHYDTIGYIDTLVVYDTSYITIYDSISVTDTLVINTPLGGAPVMLSLIKVYPNPTKDHITIDIGNVSGMSSWSIEIVNATGQSVYNTTITQSSYTVDLSTWSGYGLYYIRIRNPQGIPVETRKIILQ